MSIEGAIGACLVDWSDGAVLLSGGGEACLSVDAAGSLHAPLMRAVLGVIAGLKIGGDVDDILLTTEDQYHLIRPSTKVPNAFVYLALDKLSANAALARRKLQQAESRST